jgi:hypothetical protein
MEIINHIAEGYAKQFSSPLDRRVYIAASSACTNVKRPCAGQSFRNDKLHD